MSLRRRKITNVAALLARFTYYGNQQNESAINSESGEGRGYSADLPWADFAYAQDKTPEGYGTRPAAGIYVESSFYYPDALYAIPLSPQIPRSVTFQTNDAIRVAFFGSNTVGKQVWTGIVIDGSLASTQRGVEISSSSPVESVALNNCEITGVSQYALFSAANEGVSIYLNNLTITGDFNYSAILHNEAGRSSESEFKMTNSRLDCESSSPINDYLIWNGAQSTTKLFDYDVTYDNNDIALSIGSTRQQFDVFRPREASSYTFTDNTFAISSRRSRRTVELLKPAGNSGYRIPSVDIEKNLVSFGCGTGFALVVGGDSSGLAYTDKGTLSDNVVVGEYFPTRTPHGQTCGRSEAGDEYLIKDGISTDIYVGFLMSMGYSQSTNIIRDCLAVDCYGPSFYAKGNTDALIQNNRAVVTTKRRQRNQAILSATAQDNGTIRNVATTFDGNVVTVEGGNPITNWFALAGNTVTLAGRNEATWTNNVYNVPDTLSLSSLMFVIDGVYVSGTTWLAAFPTDTINFKTAAEIQEIIDDTYAEVEAKKAEIGSGTPYWRDNQTWSDTLYWAE